MYKGITVAINIHVGISMFCVFLTGSIKVFQLLISNVPFKIS